MTSARVGARRRGWAAAVAVAALLMAVATAAAATPAPRVVAGWPQLAPPAGDAFVVPGGPVLVSNGMRGMEGGQSAGFTRSGIRRWERTLGLPCGNCGPSATPVLSPTGILGPIGFYGSGLFAFDVGGREAPACAGAIGDDGDCYSVGLVYQGLALPLRLRVERSGTGNWATTDERLAPINDYELPAPTMAFTADTLLVAVSTSPGQLMALDRTDGTLLWVRPIGRATLGPVVSADGAVHVAGVDGVVHALDARTGVEIWRAGLSGSPSDMLRDRGAGTGVVVAVRRAGTVAVVRLDDAGHPEAVTARRPVGTRLLEISPDGTAYLGRGPVQHTRSGVLTAVDPRGRERWSFRAPAAFAMGVGRPAVAGRDLFVTIGPLAYRLRPPTTGAVGVAVPTRARLTVAPSRFRATGDPRACPAGTHASCAPRTPRGTVARLSLPGPAVGATVTSTLVRVGARSKPIPVGLPFTARAGSQWLAVAPPGNEFSWWDTRSAPRPGAYHLVVRWSAKGRRGAVSAPVTVVR